jgi:hypothetical protein
MLSDWASVLFLPARSPRSMDAISSIACHSHYFSYSASLSPSRLTSVIPGTSLSSRARPIDQAFAFRRDVFDIPFRHWVLRCGIS